MRKRSSMLRSFYALWLIGLAGCGGNEVTVTYPSRSGTRSARVRQEEAQYIDRIRRGAPSGSAREECRYWRQELAKVPHDFAHAKEMAEAGGSQVACSLRDY